MANDMIDRAYSRTVPVMIKCLDKFKSGIAEWCIRRAAEVLVYGHE